MQQAIGTRSVATLLFAAVSLAALLLLPAGGWGTTSAVLAATGAAATAIASQRHPAVAVVPVAFVSLVVAATTVAVAAGLGHMSLLSARGGSSCVWVVMLATMVAVAVLRREPMVFIGRERPTAVVLALGLLALAVVPLVQPMEIWLRHVALGTDFSRHVVIMGQIADSGYLDYRGGGYPAGLHAFVATAWRGAGGDTYTSAWTAMQGVTLLMLALTATALVCGGARVGRALQVPAVLSQAVLPVLLVLAFLLGTSVSVMMASGYTTSVLAGLIVGMILVILAGEGAWPALSTVAALAVGSAAMANAWTLLVPMIAVPAVVCWLIGPRRGWGLLILVGGALVAAPVGLGLVGITAGSASYREEITAPIQVSLWYPEWWWWCLLAFSAIAVVVAWRQGRFGLTAGLLSVGGGTVLALSLAVVLSHATLTNPGYYLLKSGWTATGLLLPVGVAGALWCLAEAWRMTGRIGTPLVVTVARTLVAGVVILCAAAAFGRFSADGEATIMGYRYGFGELPFEYVAMQQLEDEHVTVAPERPLAVWGIAPYGQANALVFGSWTDRYVSEAVRWLQPTVEQLPRALSVSRDAAAMCAFLRANPGALRITGPNDEPGLGWLKEADCPQDVVKADDWIRIAIPPEWFEGLPQEGKPYSYPTWQEWRDLMRKRIPGWGTYPPPDPSSASRDAPA